MKRGKINIMGKSWSFKKMTEDTFVKKHPELRDSGAITIPIIRQMHFIDYEFRMESVRHEVRHAFLYELCYQDADLSLDSLEEINCRLDQNQWDEMAAVHATIYKKLF